MADATCQCGESRAAVRAGGLFCCTSSGYWTVEIDEEWERHRWADWTDRELDLAGIKPDAYDKHRRTEVGSLQWSDCDDTKRGHVPAKEEHLEIYGGQVGDCIACGKKAVSRG